MAYTQENRLIAVQTPLGKDVLLLTGFSGTEGLSYPFHFELDLVSENHNIAFKDIVGKNVAVSIVLADGSKRFFHGIISRFSQGSGGGEEGEDLSYYSATMVPWLWLLTRTADSRIFQELSVPDIVEKIFTEKGFSDYKIDLNGSYDKRNYCVQYRETDFNFVSRLLEEEGIFYFFKHEEKKHTLVLADAPDKHKPCPKQASARYQISAGGREEEDIITSLEWMQEIQVGKYTLKDFNFEIPSTDLKADAPSQQSLGPGEREVYDYPGKYDKKAAGDRLANIRMQEQEAQTTIITGSGDCRAFTSGYRFDLLDYYRDDMNEKSYVLTSVNHGATEPVGGSGQGADASYTNSFTCIPFDVPYRPPCATPKPVVQGSQTAIVVGPSGEEIYTDEHGRVKVQFHWDREGKNDENSSCWMRVSQLWAGAGWGAMYIPRIGQEVIVDFLEGDPDRPIIIGRVYHGINKTPYELPAEMTKSTIKSDSSKGGGGSNEIRFEDKKGEEEIYLHGQKDWTIAIKNDKNQTVGNDETLSVANNRTKTVGADQKETIEANKTISVGKDHTESITENASIDIGKNETVSIGDSLTMTVDKNVSEKIGEKLDTSVGKNMSLEVGEDSTSQIGKDMEVKIGKELSIQAGDQVNIISDKQITLKSGSASITLKKNGDIIIKGGKIGVKGSKDVSIKGSKVMEN
jgi:type VI secretion system secreted protein VgrG